MKTIKAVFSLPLLLSFLCIPTQTQAARTPLVRYRLPEGQTNVYRVEIEVRDESGTQGLIGNVFIVPKTATSNSIVVSFRGALSPRRDAQQPYYNGPGRMRWMYPLTMNDTVEAQIDDQGHLLRVMGDPPLPIPLGSVAQLLLPIFGPGSDSRWDVADESAVIDESLNVGPAISFMNQSSGMYGSYYTGYIDSRRGPGALATMRKIHREAKLDGKELVISNRLNLASRLQFGAEPRIHGTADGQFVVDRESGLLRRSQLQFAAVSNTESVTRRSSGTVRIKLLEGKERDEALEPAQPPSTTSTYPNQHLGRMTEPTKKTLTPEEMQKALSDLKSDNDSTRSMAAMKLQTSELTNLPPETLNTMTELVNDPNTSVRMAAVRILGEYGTSEQVPALLKLLKSSDSSSRWAAIRALGRLKDKRAAEPLAALLARGSSDGYQAADALNKIGSDAEEPVLALLKEKNTETLRQACGVLKQIGTQKSVPTLRELMLDTDQSVSSSAAEAVRTITARQ